ncbi:MAG TPA: S-adenosylmethionine decarboxylase [Gemmatimonadales bacterium]|nr:S-adenosylmethionine decarboxylase [Gemmatimonadales bacterium]
MRQHPTSSPLTLEQSQAELDGITALSLRDAQGLAGLLLAAANAAGLSAANPPLVQIGPEGTGAILLCHGGHVVLEGVPDAGLCFVDVAGIGVINAQRGLDVIARRLGARHIRVESRRRGSTPAATRSEA